MASSKIPTDGPEAALARAARHLKLRYSNTFIARAVLTHPNPTSLLALVEAAAKLGIKVTAGRTEAAELNGLDSPTILHFAGAGGGGFGVLEGVTEDGFKVWDSTSGSRVIDRDAFLANWTGIVALAERAESPGAKEPDFVRSRLTEIFFGGIDPPAVVGNRAQTIVRAVVASLLVVALGVSLARVPSGFLVPAILLAVLALAGLGVTIVTGVSIAAQNSPLSDRICARGKFVDCQSVLSSRYSRIYGFALSDIGIAFYASMLLLVAADTPGAWDVVGLLFLVGLPFSLILIGTQVAMRQLCTLCLAVHTVNILGAALAWTLLRPTLTAAILAPVVVWALLFALVLLFAIPYFRKHQGLSVLAGMHRRISGSPFASLAEILTEPPTDLDALKCAVALPGTPAEHELVVFVHPSCNKCDAVFAEVRALVEAGQVTAHVGVAPKDPEESDRRACSVIVAAGLHAGRLPDAYAAAKKDLAAFVSDPVTFLADQLPSATADREVLLADARGRTDAAETFVDEHAEGTPAVFFNTRLYRGELSHLAFLLQKHPELLAETVFKDRMQV